MRLAAAGPPPINPANLEFTFPAWKPEAKKARQAYEQRFDPQAALELARSIVSAGAVQRGPAPQRDSFRSGGSRRRAPATAESIAANSLGEFIPLGKAYLLSGEEEFAQALVERLRAWREANPPFRGPCWTGAFEAAGRLANLAWGFSFLRGAKAFDAAAQREALESAYRHARFISLFLDKASAPPRRLGAAAGLVVAGAHFCLFDRAEEWKEQGLEALIQGVERWGPALRKTGDLPGLEVVLEYSILAYVMAKSVREALPISFLAELERGALALAASPSQTALRTGPTPQRTDRVCFAAAPDARRAIANALAVIRSNAELKRLGAPLDERTFWLFGPEACAAFDRL
jgi:hypothetical protein